MKKKNMIKELLRENYFYIVVLVVLLVFFFLLSKTQIMNTINVFDTEFYKLLTNKSLINPMIILTNIGYWYFPVIMILLLFSLFKNKSYSYYLTFFYAFSGLLSLIGKYLIGRSRPLEALIEMPSTPSFPSGHTLTSFCFYIGFTYLMTKNSNKQERIIYLIISTILCILIGLSRIYLGVHYLSDVIGGIILSIPCILMFFNIINKHFKEE